MNPSKAKLKTTVQLTELPNVDDATAADLRLLGIHEPHQLVGCDPMALYNRLNTVTRMQHDPCVIDVFMSAVDFMNGNKPRPWWKYTAQRKKLLAMTER